MPAVNFTNALDWQAAFVIDSNPKITLTDYIKTLTLPPITFATPEGSYGSNKFYMPADTISQGEIDIEFLIDDKFYVYSTLLEWGNECRKASNKIPFGILSVQILDSYKSPIYEITYKNCVLSNLGPLPLISEMHQELSLSATLAYSGFEYKKIQNT